MSFFASVVSNLIEFLFQSDTFRMKFTIQHIWLEKCQKAESTIL